MLLTGGTIFFGMRCDMANDNGSDPVLKETLVAAHYVLLEGIVIGCSKNTINAIR
jgi:hypothetical protein